MMEMMSPKMSDDRDAFVLESHSHNADMMIGLNNLRLEGMRSFWARYAGSV